MKSNYWLCINPETFIFSDAEKVLLYNTTLSKSYEIVNNSFFQELVKRLNESENLYSVMLTDKEYVDNKDIVDSISILGFGKCEKAEYATRPISFAPNLKLNCDIPEIINDYSNKQAGYIHSFLNELTIHLTGKYEKSNLVERQMVFPLKGDEMMEMERLMNFIHTLGGCTLNRINITCKLDKIKEYTPLFEYLHLHKYIINYYVLFSELCDNETILDYFPYFNLFIICSPIDEIVNIRDENYYLFMVSSMLDFNKAEKQISRLVNAEIIPIFNGDNKEFFIDNVYMNYRELLNMGNLSKRDIFARKTINTNFFGKMIVLPDGRLFSNINFEALGTIDDSLYEMIYKEIISGKSWMLLRNRYPCNECRFQYLCPPISNYEIVINKINLCDVRK